MGELGYNTVYSAFLKGISQLPDGSTESRDKNAITVAVIQV